MPRSKRIFKIIKREFVKKKVSVESESSFNADVLEVRLEENEITPRPRLTNNDTDDVVSSSKVKLGK